MADYNLICKFVEQNEEFQSYISAVERSNIEYQNINELFQESSVFTNVLVGFRKVTSNGDYWHHDLEFYFLHNNQLNKVSREIQMKNGVNLEKLEEVTKELAQEALYKVLSESEIKMYYIEKRLSKIEEKLL